jgi:hypothetical protein
MMNAHLCQGCRKREREVPPSIKCSGENFEIIKVTFPEPKMPNPNTETNSNPIPKSSPPSNLCSTSILEDPAIAFRNALYGLQKLGNVLPIKL